MTTKRPRTLMEHLHSYRLPSGISPEFAAGVRHHTAHVVAFACEAGCVDCPLADEPYCPGIILPHPSEDGR